MSSSADARIAVGLQEHNAITMLARKLRLHSYRRPSSIARAEIAEAQAGFLARRIAEHHDDAFGFE